jgi:predicted pyridoxine 5'-phosphate oxidase superfamily flavin-nucleotide-binding protein
MKPEREDPASPWHRGERILQTHVGVARRMEEVGRRIIRDFMPDQHRSFFAQLPFLVIGAVDADGAPWAGWLEGEPGFLSTPDAATLRVAALPGVDDPLHEALVDGAALGALGIELPTRRRNRANGVVAQRDAQGFCLKIEQSFGNCPQYIQRRELEPSGTGGTPAPEAGTLERAAGLTPSARALIRAADTFFVASYVEGEGPDAARGVDVSHRGGKPGFVRVDGNVLTIPDFAGNMQFNTLGNLLVNPRAGLCFADFQNGDLLQLTGKTEIVMQGAELASFAGAERLWRCAVERMVWRPAALRLRYRLRDLSPFSLRTGAW